MNTISQLDPVQVEQGIAHLRAVDARLAWVIDQVGAFDLTLRSDLFFALVHAIISQQISTKAKDAIVARLLAYYAPAPFPTPERILATPDDDLRSIGCSRAKVVYLKDLSTRIVANELDLSRLPSLLDEEVIQSLTHVKGIGRWTAEMLLIFSLGRLDVWPVDDLGIAAGVQKLYGLAERPTRKELLAIGERWRPYRSLVCFYLWRGGAALAEAGSLQP